MHSIPMKIISSFILSYIVHIFSCHNTTLWDTQWDSSYSWNNFAARINHACSSWDVPQTVPEMSLKQFLRCPSNSSWDVPQTVPEMSPKQNIRLNISQHWQTGNTGRQTDLLISAPTDNLYTTTCTANWTLYSDPLWPVVVKLDTVQWPPLASGGQTGHCTVTPFGQWWSMTAPGAQVSRSNDSSRSTSFTEQWQLQEHKFHRAMIAPGAPVSRSNECSSGQCWQLI